MARVVAEPSVPSGAGVTPGHMSAQRSSQLNSAVHSAHCCSVTVCHTVLYAHAAGKADAGVCVGANAGADTSRL